MEFKKFFNQYIKKVSLNKYDNIYIKILSDNKKMLEKIITLFYILDFVDEYSFDTFYEDDKLCLEIKTDSNDLDYSLIQILQNYHKIGLIEIL